MNISISFQRVFLSLPKPPAAVTAFLKEASKDDFQGLPYNDLRPFVTQAAEVSSWRTPQSISTNVPAAKLVTIIPIRNQQVEHFGADLGRGAVAFVRPVTVHLPIGTCQLVTGLFSLRENAIAKEPGSSYLKPWRSASRLGW
jgi:hypothetical protein